MPTAFHELIAQLPKLDQPILFWDGRAGLATLAHSPKERWACYSVDELKHWLKTQSPTSRPQAATDAPSSSVQWSGFQQGWAGYFSYEAGHALITGQNRTPKLPLAEFAWYEHSLQAAIATLPSAPSNTPLHWQAHWDFDTYHQAFNQVQSYLKAGDCYQVNLAMPFSTQQALAHRSPLPLLQRFNPAFGGYIKTPSRSLFSVSPERFIAIQGQQLETRPIKGTVARSQDPEKDAANQAWLKNSRKNQAENLMIVDLLRNDLSRYALPHSVQVEKLFALETHANVHHLVSTIRATKKAQISMAEIISGALPGGSITGAPKKRAMEIIAELEGQARGAYCGVMGYFDTRGIADFNILIRTIEAQSSSAQCWAGGGLVLDSQCEEEWQELHTKVARILTEF